MDSRNLVAPKIVKSSSTRSDRSRSLPREDFAADVSSVLSGTSVKKQAYIHDYLRSSITHVCFHEKKDNSKKYKCYGILCTVKYVLIR